ncbi:MAG: hypothetical protein LBQ92_05375 [Propionibacteriaceae bacterium]|jgi:hypothetical protein|nr:hypothetical protein [Propionibacteriaceae bacterium]
MRIGKLLKKSDPLRGEEQRLSVQGRATLREITGVVETPAEIPSRRSVRPKVAVGLGTCGLALALAVGISVWPHSPASLAYADTVDADIQAEVSTTEWGTSGILKFPLPEVDGKQGWWVQRFWLKDNADATLDATDKVTFKRVAITGDDTQDAAAYASEDIPGIGSYGVTLYGPNSAMCQGTGVVSVASGTAGEQEISIIKEEGVTADGVDPVSVATREIAVPDGGTAEVSWSSDSGDEPEVGVWTSEGEGAVPADVAKESVVSVGGGDTVAATSDGEQISGMYTIIWLCSAADLAEELSTGLMTTDTTEIYTVSAETTDLDATVAELEALELTSDGEWADPAAAAGLDSPAALEGFETAGAAAGPQGAPSEVAVDPAESATP